MKVFSVVGYTNSGKTTTIEHIIKELKKRGYSVGSAKDIHCQDFKMDSDGSNTDRHMQAGSELVIARATEETDVLFPRRLSAQEILRFFDQDFVILESVEDANVPKIITLKDKADLKAKQDGREFLVSGVISNDESKIDGLKIMNAVNDIEAMVDYIEEKVPEILPDSDEACCGACGMSCRQLLIAILNGEKKRSDCVLDNAQVSLKIGGKEIKMVPFVQRVLRNNILAVARELEGYKDDMPIAIELKKRQDNIDQL